MEGRRHKGEREGGREEREGGQQNLPIGGIVGTLHNTEHAKDDAHFRQSLKIHQSIQKMLCVHHLC